VQASLSNALTLAGIEADPAATANVAAEVPTAPGQPESFVFPVTVSLDETAMKIDNAAIPITRA
jgi:hemolysin D